MTNDAQLLVPTYTRSCQRSYPTNPMSGYSRRYVHDSYDEIGYQVFAYGWSEWCVTKATSWCCWNNPCRPLGPYFPHVLMGSYSLCFTLIRAGAKQNKKVMENVSRKKKGNEGGGRSLQLGSQCGK